jgi:hydrogenase maturation protein HypF
MPGGAAAVRQPWRMAAAHLAAAYTHPPADLEVVRRQGRRWDHVLAAARAGVNAPPTTSAGRLFDAVAAILGLRDEVTYEGQAAVELEHCADPAERSSYPVRVGAGPPYVVDSATLVRAVVDDLRAGSTAPTIAARFHEAVADVVLEVCRRVRDAEGLSTVALSGGVFQNARLVAGCLERLEAAGFEVLTHRQVPPNDGGLSLGQAAVAGARDRAGLV